MKRSKRFFSFAAGAACLALALGATGCALIEQTPPVGIASIEKTATDGLVDTYTIYYTDGTTSEFTVTNGKDGSDGKDGVNSDDAPVSIRSIEKTATDGLVDTYTVYYTDGTTSEFTITNGEKGEDGRDGVHGEDGQDITALDLYETYKDVYGDDLTYAEFLSKYLSLGETTDTYTVINDCLQSVGKIYCEFTELDTSTTTDTEDTKLALYGGACAVYRIDDDYTYFLTNYHVVYSKAAVDGSISDSIYCYLYGSESSPAKKTGENGEAYVDYGNYAIACEYVGGAVEYDLAIVRAETAAVRAVNENVKAITFAEDYHVGETAIAIGNPNGEGISVTQGIVSVDSDNITLVIDGKARSYRSIRIDTALYHGNSGGGLFNEKGQLIGVANAGDVNNQNINYAVPLEIVKAVTDNVMYYAMDGDDTTNGVYKITVGVTVTGQNAKYVYDEGKGYGKIVEDVLVMEVAEGSIAADKLGIQAGDVLKAIVVDGVRYDIGRYFEIGHYVLALHEGVSYYFIKDTGETTGAYTVQKSDLNNVA
jgi:S1-C subfamily serine protease